MVKLLAGLVLSVFCLLAGAQESPIVYSDFQRGFMEIIREYANKYPKAENELQKSALVTERYERFKKLKGDPRGIKKWIGVIESMGTNGDGKAFVVLNLSPKLLNFSTWNNSFSDSSDRSLIPQSSPIFAKLAKMKEGNVVYFSGRLKRTKNMTEEGKMTSPDFLFVFSDIEKKSEWATPFK